MTKFAHAPGVQSCLLQIAVCDSFALMRCQTTPHEKITKRLASHHAADGRAIAAVP
jgi:hypothetical protein